MESQGNRILAAEGELSPAANGKDADFGKRINSMFNRDRLFGWVFVVCLWITYLFTFFAVTTVSKAASDSVVYLALLVGGLLVLIYNTASIGAMIRHYAEDKEFIYAVDLRHLDRLKAKKRKA